MRDRQREKIEGINNEETEGKIVKECCDISGKKKKRSCDWETEKCQILLFIF